MKQNRRPLAFQIPAGTPEVKPPLIEAELFSDKLSFNGAYLRKNGEPWLPVMGEFQYSRYPAGEWEDEILKMKACGVEILGSYLFWNHHEEERGKFDFTGRRNLRRFVELCGRHRMPVWLRIGPFVHGESRNGGLPDWLYGQPFTVRSNDAGYLDCVRELFRRYGEQCAGLFAGDGGPILGIQLENEFMHSGAPWECTRKLGTEYLPSGTGGLDHMRKLGELAAEANLSAPFVSCTSWGGAPVPEGCFAMTGAYSYHAWLANPADQPPTPNYLFCDLKRKYNREFVADCETGGGMQTFYSNRPVVPAESVSGNALVRVASGVELLGYYVFHGGSNPRGRHSMLNESSCPRISYDFQAPLREFGQVNRPVYAQLKRFHLFLNGFGHLAAMKSALPDLQPSGPEDTDTPRAGMRTDGNSGFLFFCNFQDHVENRKLEGVSVLTEIGGERLRTPSTGTLSLPAGMAAVLPLRLDLSGILLKSATVQPLTALRIGEETVWFFFAPDGMPPEYLFGPETEIAEPGTSRVSVLPAGKRVVPAPGTDSAFVLAGGEQGPVRIFTLTDAQSLQFWKARLSGRDFVFLSDADLFFKAGIIEMRQTANPGFRIAVYPPLRELLVRGKTLRPKPDGAFAAFEHREPAKADPVTVTPCRDESKTRVAVPEDALDGLDDIILSIACRGDVGEAFIDGQLIADNFCNGQNWEIGLRRFLPQAARHGIVIRINGAAGQSNRTEMGALGAVPAEAGTSGVLSITPLLRYRCSLKPRLRGGSAGKA